jgi:DNA-binding transcriptional MerR regulator
MSKQIEAGAKGAAGEALPIGRAFQTNAYEYNLLIDIVARMFSISAFELRMYEFLGLIRRERMGDDWAYSWSHCERVALIVRGREAGLRLRDLRPVIAAMEETASQSEIDKGKSQALTLIRTLQADSSANDRALDELLRVDWELSSRLALASGGSQPDARKLPQSGIRCA